MDPDAMVPRLVSEGELAGFQKAGSVLVGGNAGGEEFYFSPGGYYVKPFADAKKLKDTIENEYVQKNLETLTNLLFSEKPKDHVKDESGSEDREIMLRMERDFEKKDVERFSNMKLSWQDAYCWGIYIMQPVFRDAEDGWVSPVLLKRLPPESFSEAPPDTRGWKCDEILKGIGLRNGKREFWQSGSGIWPVKLENVYFITDPVMKGIAGKSRLLSLMPLVSLIDFCWKAQAQKIGRVGAPILFIRFTSEPKVIESIGRDDFNHARKIIKNWGKESSFVLRDNMELLELKQPDNQSSLQTIEMLKKDIADHFNPSTFLDKDSSTIGGSDSGRVDFTTLAIQSIHGWVEDAWEPLMDDYLRLNGFENYHDELELPTPQPDRADLNLRRAEAIDKMGIGTIQEKRRLAGLPEASEEELAEIEEERNQRSAMVPGTKPYGQNEDAEADGEEGGRPQENFKEDDGEPEMNLFPYPGEHAARMVNPGSLEENSFRRKNIAPGVDVILGKKGGKMVVQAYRFKKSKFTAAGARAWLKKHGIHPRSFHAATGGE